MVARLTSLRPFLPIPRYLAAFETRVIPFHITPSRNIRTFATSTRFPWQASKVFEPRVLRIDTRQTPLLSIRRFKSGKVQTTQVRAAENDQLGDEPPLYDGKPPFWARWVFFLLALDVLFIGFSVDMVMRNWTRLVERPSSSRSSPGSASPHTNREYELRPLWQRLGLATFEIFIGVAAGALILASRDRTVWRIRIQRMPINAGSTAKTASPSTTTSKLHSPIILVLETGSGRRKRFIMRDAVLMPGRDLSELFLEIPGIRGRFILPMNGARVLGTTPDKANESQILKELLTSEENKADVALINSTPWVENEKSAGMAELRKALALAWIRVGGILSVPTGTTQTGGWTSGPITERTR